METAVKLSQGNPRFLAYLGYADAVVGNKTDAQKILKKLDALSQQQYVSPLEVGLIYVGLNKKEAALAWLETAYEVHDVELYGIARDPKVEPLHSDPRFQDLIRRVGLAR